MKRFVTLWNLLGLAVLALGLTVYLYTDRRQGGAVLNLPETLEEASTPRALQLRLYFGKPDGTGFVVERRQVQLEPGENPYERALAELVRGPAQGGTPLVPPGMPPPTVFVAGDTAYVDLPAAYGRLGYGSAGEVLLLFGMANTLLEFDEIGAVKFLLAGREVPTLGHVSLVDPIRKTR